MDDTGNDRARFAAEYERALRDFLAAGGGEAGLLRADDLGHRGVASKLSLVELVAIHHAALHPLAGGRRPDDGVGRLLAASEEFLQQVLVAYEIVGRGFAEASILNAELERASRLKSEFLANMSHELRTPLNAIIGFSELIHDEKVGPISETQQEYLGDVLTSARHLLDLINDVLDLAKVEAGRVIFHPEPVDLRRLVGEVRDTLGALAATKGIQIAAEIDPALSTTEVDPARMKQILYNYLSNALKFTPEDGCITIRARGDRPGTFRVEVEDSGIGIQPEDLGRLFVEFQQLDAGASKKYPGTGLGLALTKRLVEAQGGQVGVRSVPGQGSTFYAILPRVWRPTS